ncbi:lipase [Luteimonas fraxinea]|uniref:lipase n=1 Tax=Luteimonas fraxinea TaxID=2901869 RepID=UPI001E2A77CC|nr:lipase [Luteimonas fraxinea]MCD9125365.1 lipase [Luteimonas fraxinea]UHH09170.1 lipase [Luteimonas fraxinea]
MSVPSQQYAGLANDSYEDRRVGVRSPPYNEHVTIEGVDYRIREHVNNARTGYQGTVYQRADTGEIVVAHRGTEQIWKDGVVADGSMVASRTNPQANDAIELTRRAIGYAEQSNKTPGRAAPEVTVTGHSLGGTLAQVSAHHFDLRGETFNAYGAASLDRRIPEGGNRVLNHVMAADAVSSASPHYGQVRIYATEREMTVLRQSGYHEHRGRDFITPDFPLTAAGRSFGSHSMHNFLPVDGDGKPDRSILNDQAARTRANDNDRSIESYRSDIEARRVGATVISRGPGGLIRDGVDAIRGPLPAGEPARREEEQSQRGRDGRRASVDAPSDRGDVQLARNEGTTQQDYVSRLLDAAKSGNSESIRNATQDLQSSPSGQAWQQRADQEAQQLAQRDAAQQSGPTHQEAARQA